MIGRYLNGAARRGFFDSILTFCTYFTPILRLFYRSSATLGWFCHIDVAHVRLYVLLFNFYVVVKIKY